MPANLTSAKVEGNAAYSAGEYKKAIEMYEAGMKHGDVSNKEDREVMIRLKANTAAAHLELGQYNDASKAAKEAHDLIPPEERPNHSLFEKIMTRWNKANLFTREMCSFSESEFFEQAALYRPLNWIGPQEYFTVGHDNPTSALYGCDDEFTHHIPPSDLSAIEEALRDGKFDTIEGVKEFLVQPYKECGGPDKYYHPKERARETTPFHLDPRSMQGEYAFVFAGCGDTRHPLATLADLYRRMTGLGVDQLGATREMTLEEEHNAEAAGKLHPDGTWDEVRLHMTLNDVSAPTIARSVVLFTLLLDLGEVSLEKSDLLSLERDTETLADEISLATCLYELYFAQFLSSCAWKTLQQHLKKLQSLEYIKETYPMVRIDDEEWPSILKYLTSWEKLFESSSFKASDGEEEIITMREESVKRVAMESENNRERLMQETSSTFPNQHEIMRLFTLLQSSPHLRHTHAPLIAGGIRALLNEGWVCPPVFAYGMWDVPNPLLVDDTLWKEQYPSRFSPFQSSSNVYMIPDFVSHLSRLFVRDIDVRNEAVAELIEITKDLVSKDCARGIDTAYLAIIPLFWEASRAMLRLGDRLTLRFSLSDATRYLLSPTTRKELAGGIDRLFLSNVPDYTGMLAPIVAARPLLKPNSLARYSKYLCICSTFLVLSLVCLGRAFSLSIFLSLCPPSTSLHLSLSRSRFLSYLRSPVSRALANLP